MKNLTNLSHKFENDCKKAKEVILSLKDVERAKNKKYQEGNWSDFLSKDQLLNMQTGAEVL